MRHLRDSFVILSIVLAAACARTEDDDGGGGGTADARRNADARPADAAVTADARPPADASIPDASAVDVVPSPVVFNEIKGEDPDWMELFNTSSAAVDLSGHIVADSNSGTTEPDLGDALTFPAGTTIEPGAYLFLLEDEAATPGPSTECAPSPAASCFKTTFGVSEATGERVHLLAPGMAEVGSFDYPSGVAATKTYGRYPDGSATLGAMDPTPGAANTAP
jgi:hypothetical protein